MVDKMMQRYLNVKPRCPGKIELLNRLKAYAYENEKLIMSSLGIEEKNIFTGTNRRKNPPHRYPAIKEYREDYKRYSNVLRRNHFICLICGHILLPANKGKCVKCHSVQVETRYLGHKIVIYYFEKTGDKIDEDELIQLELIFFDLLTDKLEEIFSGDLIEEKIYLWIAGQLYSIRKTWDQRFELYMIAGTADIHAYLAARTIKSKKNPSIINTFLGNCTMLSLKSMLLNIYLRIVYLQPKVKPKKIFTGK